MDYTVLQKAPLFYGLSIDEIEKVMSSVPFRTKKFKAGTLIVQSGDKVRSLQIVINGAVKGEMVDFTGRIIKIEDIYAPGALAAAFMFGDRDRFPVNVISISDAELLIIEKPDFLKLLMQNDILLVNFLDMISNRSQFLSEKIKFLNFKTIRGKLAHFILQRAGNDRNSVSLKMTQSELAEFFGVTRPSVARAIGELEQMGLIEAKGKNIIILDRKKLASLLID